MRRSISFPSRTTCLATGQLIDAVCVFFGRSDLDMSVIDDEIQAAIKTRSPVPDVLALVSFGGVADQLADTWRANPERATGLVQRGRSDQVDYLKEVGIWAFRDGRLELIHRDQRSRASFQLDLPVLVRTGLAWLVDKTRAFQIAPSGHVFRHPSKRKSKYFLLASELVRDEIDAYFVGLCVCLAAWPRLSGVGTLHIDTMGIYAVARAVEDIVSSSGGRVPTPWRIDSFHSHDGIDGLHAVIEADEAVLISASTTGSMAASFADSGVPEAALITLLDVSEVGRRSTIVYARDSYPPVPTFPVREISAVDHEETVIDLTGEYFVATGKRPRPLLLSKDHRPAALSTLLNQFSGAEACWLNRRRPGLPAATDVVSLDGDRIAANPEFRKWVEAEIRAKTPASVSHVMHLPGAGAEALAEYCADAIGALVSKRPLVIQQTDLFTIDVPSVSGIMTCAALVGNGHALRAASRDLREVVPAASRHFLVGVGLPTSEEAWRRLGQFLVQSGDPNRPYLFSQWLSLPTGCDSGSDQAWVRGAALMQKTEQMLVRADSPWNRDSVQSSLQLVGDVLVQAAGGFLPTAAGASQRLTRGFVYWSPGDARQLEAANHAAASFLAMASGLQTAREFKEASKCLRSTLHEMVVLDPENFLRFNDGVLQASLLRAARPYELDYSAAPELSEVMREFLEKVFENQHRSYGEAALEFGFALATGQLRLTAADTRVLLQRLIPRLAEASVLLGFLYCVWDMSER
jgi:hypothetical protein